MTCPLGWVWFLCSEFTVANVVKADNPIPERPAFATGLHFKSAPTPTQQDGGSGGMQLGIVGHFSLSFSTMSKFLSSERRSERLVVCLHDALILLVPVACRGYLLVYVRERYSSRGRNRIQLRTEVGNYQTTNTGHARKNELVSCI
jgi:hypothetical protein